MFLFKTHLELVPDGEDLVDEVLHTDDVGLAELVLHDGVGGDGHALAGDLGESALVDQLEKLSFC